MLIHGFFPEEWQQFSKTERRILALVHDMKYEREEICRLLEIKDGTLRFHIAAIRRKQSKFREERAKKGVASDHQRAMDVSLPQPTISEEEKVMEYKSHDKQGREVLIKRNVSSGLTMKELLEPLDGAPILPAAAPGKVPASPFLQVPNPTMLSKAIP